MAESTKATYVGLYCNGFALGSYVYPSNELHANVSKFTCPHCEPMDAVTKQLSVRENSFDLPGRRREKAEEIEKIRRIKALWRAKMVSPRALTPQVRRNKTFAFQKTWY
ncbi:hypothetical protein DPMN_102124 [Dreissena polymorpha]|uniref:Uncharacterized protein n=1 Tax=Dreissena polymorpha TaxID=45954 RepID=A0A9D4LKJ6_DREPO|nr:hypothetical protein DPMN_102124 [Dreissena polymorpha]